MTYKKQQGLSLIELMIAVTIGLLLLMGTASMMISNKRIYKEQNEMGRLQENARFAMELIMKDVRRSAFIGCMDRQNGIRNHLNGSGTSTNLFSLNNLIEGSESGGNWLPSNSTDATTDMTAGSDGFTVRFLEPINVTVSASMPNKSANLQVTSVTDVVEGDILAVSDCDSTDIFQVTGIGSNTVNHNTGGSATPGNSTKDFSKSYPADAMVARAISRRYFIANDAATGESGLFMY
ncbi:MAG TPA: prepilin-type N-terminal cleavage/methylation domain-containing protein, partial [Pseudomonadales bacterium]|nr:prepilin-type N-terminal cleavage/methylation domain-containing protein [Pseudomonadales bacterium]